MRVNKPFFLSLVLGSFLATICWPLIRLPFENPLEIVGLLNNIEENPSNDIVRYLVYLTFPIFIYMFFWKISSSPHIYSVQLTRKKVSISKTTWVLYFILTICCGIFIIQENPIFDPFHEGESLGPAIDFLEGKIPYQDFIFCHGLIQDPLRAAWGFELFGQSIGSFRTMSSLLELLAVIFLSIFLIRYFKGNIQQATFAFILLIFLQKTLDFIYSHGGNNWVSPISFQQGRDSTLYLFLIVLTFFNPKEFSLLGWQKQFFVIFFMAFIPIISFIYSIDRGFYITGSSFLIFILLLFFNFESKRLKYRTTLFYLIGILSGLSVLYLVFKEGFNDFIKYTFIEMPQYKEFLDGTPYPIFDYRFNIALLLIAFLVLFACTQLHNFYLQNKNWKMAFKALITDYFIEISILICAVIFYRSVLGRSDLFHLRYSIHVSILLFFIVFVQLYWDKITWINQRFNLILVCLLIAVTYRIYDKNLLSEIFPLTKSDKEYVSKEYFEVVNHINNDKDQTASVYSLSSKASWYYFLNQSCPTRFPVTYFAQRNDYQKQLIESLDRKRVKYIHFDNSSYITYLDSIHIFDRIPIVHHYVMGNYVRDTIIGKEEIWIRKGY